MPLLATALATQLWWPTGWGYPDQRHFVASCLVGGAAVQRFAQREARHVGLAQLGHMFGKQRVEGNALAKHYVKSWHDDPRIKGGYFSLPVGIDQESLLQELEAPEGETHPHLFFAGDYDEASRLGPQRLCEWGRCRAAGRRSGQNEMIS